MVQSGIKWSYLFSIGLILSLALTNCASPEGDSPLTVSGSWARPGPQDSPGAVYLTITNRGSTRDTLTGGETAACEVLEIHETVEREDGVMGMQPVEGGIAVSGGGEIKLEPGGYHLMCIGRTRDFKEGESLLLQLNFKQAGTLDLDVPIRRPE